MNAWKFALSATAALVLAACGSNSGNGIVFPQVGNSPTVKPSTDTSANNGSTGAGNTAGSGSTGAGNTAGSAGSAGAGNTAGSGSAGAGNTAGSGSAGAGNTAGSGSSAGAGNTAGSGSTGAGNTAGSGGSTGAGNTAGSGSSAGAGNTAGSGSAGAGNTAGSGSTGAGNTAGSGSTGAGNTAGSGSSAGAGNTAGSGSSAGAGNTAGSGSTPAPTGQYTGHFSSGNTQLAGETKAIANNEFNAISINGVTIDLPTAKSEPGFPLSITKNTISELGGLLNLHVGKDLEHAVYGFVEDYKGLADNTRFAFVQGEESKSVPASGKVTYTGYAIVSNNLHQGRQHGVWTGRVDAHDNEVRLDVDFGTKKLSGQVNSTIGGIISLQADIKGSKFEGANRDGWETKGAFYGPNAAEAAGTFRNLKDKTAPTLGVFGTRKTTE